MKVSVIISYYNKYQVLFLLLKALENQSVKNFDIIIADDGSNDESSDNINQYLKQSPLKVTRVWHEDKGFRKNKILNQAILASESDYLIFIDGDCIPQKFFVEDHIKNAELGFALNGRRVDLCPKMSSILLQNESPEIFFDQNKVNILTRYLFLSSGKNIEKGLRITCPKLKSYLNRKTKGLVGCNMSFFKQDILDINGFDERYEAAGVGEDSDIDFRLRGNGLKIKNIFYQANQLHIYHQELPREKINDDIFNSVIQAKAYRTPFGIKKESQ